MLVEVITKKSIMETFKINIQELLSRTVEVQAINKNEAVAKVNEMYKSEEIVLDYNDLSKREIIPMDLIDEKDILTKEIIDYLYREEKKHFEEFEDAENHIFKKLERLKNLVE